MTDDACWQYVESVNNEIQVNRIARMEGFFNFAGKYGAQNETFNGMGHVKTLKCGQLMGCLCE